MKILFCNYEYPPLGGGGGVINAMLAQELAKRHEVTILTSQSRQLPRVSMEDGVRVVRVPVFFRKNRSVANLVSMFPYIPLGILSGNQLLKAEGFDVINTHFVLPSGPVGDALAHMHNLPNVLTIHGGDIYDPSKFTSPHRHAPLRAWVRRLLYRADMVIGQSKDTLRKMREYYTPEIEGTLIPLGIRQPLFDPAPRPIYNFGDDEFLMVTIGRLIPRKAMHQLIEIMESFRDEKVRLIIIGSGPQESTLRKEARARGLEGQIQFMGYVEETEKFRIMQMADLYVSTSQHEGFCLAFLEAMASGLPVISYDHGGQTDFLEDQTTGFLVPLNDKVLFRDRIRTLLENRDMQTAMSQENLARVQQYYLERCAARYEELFQIALERFSPERRARVVQTQTIP